MCSRASKKKTNLTECPKLRKSKTMEPTYSTPYSQSWAGAPIQNERKKAKKTLPKKEPAQKLPKREMSPGPRNAAPDPTVHHLKYGLFPKKESRVLTRVVRPKTPVPPLPERRKVEDDFDKMTSDRTPKGETPMPYFMVRSLDAHLTKHLSRAASTHLDIKPKNM